MKKKRKVKKEKFKLLTWPFMVTNDIITSPITSPGIK